MPTPKNHRIHAFLDFLSISVDGQNKNGLIEILVIPIGDEISGNYTNVSPDSILQFSLDGVYDYTNAVVELATSFRSVSDKIELFATTLAIELRTQEIAVVSISSNANTAIDSVFSAAWSELW